MNSISNGKERSNPFDFKNIKPFEKSFADLPGPMLVFPLGNASFRDKFRIIQEMVQIHVTC